MTTLEERLRRDLQDAEPPADPSGVVDRVLRKAARRHAGRTAGMVVLGIVVVAGSIGGVYGLSQIFGERAPREPKPATPASTNEFIIVSRELPGEGQHLFAVSPDGSGEQRLTPEGRAVYREPDVSPDGRVVVVAHEIPSFEPGQSILATVPIDGGSPTWLAEETWVIFDPAWSPDGARIAFAGSPGGPFGIYVFDIATGETRLVPGTDEIPVGQPTWSPDGATLAFEASTNGDQDPAPWDIYSAALDGSDMTNLTNTPDVDETQPAWSWAVDRIAFIEAGPAEGALRKMAPDGMDAVTVYSGELVPGNPVWSPDGTSIAFQVGGAEVGEENILIADADGDGPLVVPNLLGTDPAWQTIPVDQGVIPTSSPEPTRSAGPTPSQSVMPSGNVDNPVAIDGVPFPVCDVDSLDWLSEVHGFGQAFTFEEAVSDVCDSAVEGPQYVGVTTQPPNGISRVDAYFGPLDRCVEPTGCWVYATPELDGDPPDEILLLTNGAPHRIEVWFIDVAISDGEYTVKPFVSVCAANTDCDPMLIGVIDWEPPGLAGLACGRFAPDGSYSYSPGDDFYEWSSDTGDGWMADRWTFSEGRAHVDASREFVSHGDPRDVFAPSDDAEICLEPVALPDYVVTD